MIDISAPVAAVRRGPSMTHLDDRVGDERRRGCRSRDESVARRDDDAGDDRHRRGGRATARRPRRRR